MLTINKSFKDKRLTRNIVAGTTGMTSNVVS